MSELRTLIDVSAGTRLPQYEVEIFSDVELTEYYLHKLCGNEWFTVPSMVFLYAKSVMRRRWPEAEHLIATDPLFAYYYAIDVICARWHEAEPVIATDPRWACYYATYVMKSTWPEAEAVIATDREYREWYNDAFGTNI